MKNPVKRRIAALGAVLAAMVFAAALPALAAPAVDHDRSVIDNANVLTDDTETYITNISAALSKACGAQIGVYTVANTGNTTTENYCYELAQTWQIGDKDKDNGVVLLMVTDGDDYWITQGAGLETQLKTSTLSGILSDKMEPNWVAGKYDDGARETVEAVAERIAGIYDLSMDVNAVGLGQASGAAPAAAAEKKSGGFGIGGIVLVVILLIAVLVLLSSFGRRRRRRGVHFVPFFGGPRGPRPPRPPRPPYSGGPRPPRPPRGFGGDADFHTGGGSFRGGGAGRRPGGSSRPSGGGFHSGGSSGGGFHTGGGSFRGGGAGRH